MADGKNAAARRLGSAKSGVHHWWMQRVSAIALVPLSLWFIWHLLALAGAGHARVAAFAAAPVNMALLALLILALFYHMALGLQVVIEDYVHHEGRKLAALLVMQLACTVLAVIALTALLHVAFAG